MAPAIITAGTSISAQSKQRPFNLPSSGHSPHSGGAPNSQDGAGGSAGSWRRNLGGLLGPRPIATATALAALLVPAGILAGALAAGQGVAALLLWSAGVATSGLLRTGSGHAAAWALLYPLDALLLAAVVAAGWRDRRRGRLLSWKGRELRM